VAAAAVGTESLRRGLDPALGLVAGISFAAQLILGTMLPVLPVFAQGIGATPTILALMVSVSAVAAALGQVVGGLVADRVGARRLLPAGLLAYGIGSLATAGMTAALPVVALRSLTGLGSGAYIVGERLYIRQIVDRARLAFANSLVQAAAATGLIIGPLLGGAIADASDLRTPILLFGALSLVVAALALVLPARRHPEAADAPEAAIAANRDGSRRGLVVLLFANLAFVAGYGSFITTFAPFASSSLGWSATETGIAFSLFALGNVVGAPMLGAAADRWGRRLVGALSAIPIVAFAVALVVPAPNGLLDLLAFAAGAGVAGFTASWYTLLSVATGGPGGGRAFGAVAGIASLGVIVGAELAGFLWESVGIQAGMVVTVVAMAIAGIVLTGYRELRTDRPTIAR
jgi:MFS family permease